MNVGEFCESTRYMNKADAEISLPLYLHNKTVSTMLTWFVFLRGQAIMPKAEYWVKDNTLCITRQRGEIGAGQLQLCAADARYVWFGRDIGWLSVNDLDYGTDTLKLETIGDR